MLRGFLLSVVCCVSVAVGQERPPNVLVVLTDDQGAGDLSLHGNESLATPHMDSLARDGVQLTRFFVQPVCAPTRAEFLTGRYHPRGGVRGVSRGTERLDADETTIADLFRAAGYATGCFGKWHNGTQAPYHPLSRGFDRFYGFTHGHWGQYFDPLIDDQGELVRVEGYISDLFTDRLLEWVEEQGDRPFFAYLAYNTPHSPMQVPDRFWEQHAERTPAQRGTRADRFDLTHTRAAYAMVENLDWNLGRILAGLRERGLENDTIVVFFCDNGPNGHRYNRGLRGIKGSTDEGGVRSPLFVRWPGHVPEGARHATVSGAIDLLPTLAGLSGVAIPEQLALDGVNLQPLLLGQVERIDTGARIAHWGGRVSVRTADRRLDHRGRAFDMLADIGQHKALEGESGPLKALADAWRQDVLSEFEKAPRPFTVGYPPLRTTELPARDAQLVGGLKRSSRHPNDSYVLQWRKVGDGVRWPILLAEGGRFRASVSYACPEADLGARLRLSAGADAVECRVDVAHEAEAIGAADDRAPRTESLVKHFARLDVGEIELAAGRSELSLSALEIPGSQALEFASLFLERLD